jgi:hypothetical protein
MWAITVARRSPRETTVRVVRSNFNGTTLPISYVAEPVVVASNALTPSAELDPAIARPTVWPSSSTDVMVYVVRAEMPPP